MTAETVVPMAMYNVKMSMETVSVTGRGRQVATRPTTTIGRKRVSVVPPITGGVARLLAPMARQQEELRSQARQQQHGHEGADEHELIEECASALGLDVKSEQVFGSLSQSQGLPPISSQTSAAAVATFSQCDLLAQVSQKQEFLADSSPTPLAEAARAAEPVPQSQTYQQQRLPPFAYRDVEMPNTQPDAIGLSQKRDRPLPMSPDEIHEPPTQRVLILSQNTAIAKESLEGFHVSAGGAPAPPATRRSPIFATIATEDSLEAMIPTPDLKEQLQPAVVTRAEEQQSDAAVHVLSTSEEGPVAPQPVADMANTTADDKQPGENEASAALSEYHTPVALEFCSQTLRPEDIVGLPFPIDHVMFRTSYGSASASPKSFAAWIQLMIDPLLGAATIFGVDPAKLLEASQGSTTLAAHFLPYMAWTGACDDKLREAMGNDVPKHVKLPGRHELIMPVSYAVSLDRSVRCDISRAELRNFYKKFSDPQRSWKQKLLAPTIQEALRMDLIEPRPGSGAAIEKGQGQDDYAKLFPWTGTGSGTTLDILSVMLDSEQKHRVYPNFMEAHTDLTPKMRAILVDWLSEVSHEFYIGRETLHLAVGYVDRYLQAVTMAYRKSGKIGELLSLGRTKSSDSSNNGSTVRESARRCSTIENVAILESPLATRDAAQRASNSSHNSTGVVHGRALFIAPRGQETELQAGSSGSSRSGSPTSGAEAEEPIMCRVARMAGAPIDQQHLQLLGIAALATACKLEEIHPPARADLEVTTDGTCSAKDISAMESCIIRALEWNLHVPTIYSFARLYLKLLTTTSVELLYEEEKKQTKDATMNYLPTHRQRVLADFWATRPERTPSQVASQSPPEVRKAVAMVSPKPAMQGDPFSKDFEFDDDEESMETRAPQNTSIAATAARSETNGDLTKAFAGVMEDNDEDDPFSGVNGSVRLNFSSPRNNPHTTATNTTDGMIVYTPSGQSAASENALRALKVIAHSRAEAASHPNDVLPPYFELDKLKELESRDFHSYLSKTNIPGLLTTIAGANHDAMNSPVLSVEQLPLRSSAFMCPMGRLYNKTCTCCAPFTKKSRYVSLYTPSAHPLRVHAAKAQQRRATNRLAGEGQRSEDVEEDEVSVEPPPPSVFLAAHRYSRLMELLDACLMDSEYSYMLPSDIAAAAVALVYPEARVLIPCLFDRAALAPAFLFVSRLSALPFVGAGLPRKPYYEASIEPHEVPTRQTHHPYTLELIKTLVEEGNRFSDWALKTDASELSKAWRSMQADLNIAETQHPLPAIRDRSLEPSKLSVFARLWNFYTRPSR